MIFTTIAAIEFTVIVLWNVLLKKINCCGKEKQLIEKITSVDSYYHKVQGYRKVYVGTILKKTAGGDVHYKDFLVTNSKDETFL